MQIYIVQKGDTLQTIANKYNLSLQEVIDLNPHILDVDHLVQGMKIKLPRQINLEKGIEKSKDSLFSKSDEKKCSPFRSIGKKIEDINQPMGPELRIKQQNKKVRLSRFPRKSHSSFQRGQLRNPTYEISQYMYKKQMANSPNQLQYKKVSLQENYKQNRRKVSPDPLLYRCPYCACNQSNF